MLIVGCGDVGQHIASGAQAHGEPVYCVVGSADSAARLQARGLQARAIDLDRAAPAVDGDWDQAQIYYFAPPPPQGTGDPRIGRFLAALRGTAHRIVYISTTGVYGDCGGAWVDETRQIDPQVDRARRRADAERRLHAWRDAGGGELVVLRVAGIYGPGKLPLERLRQQAPMVGADEAPWTNRIHIDDLVQVCAAAMARGRDGETYNVSDGNPGNMRDYFDRVADLYELPRAPLIRLADADGTLSAGLLSYLGESRRLSNRKMLDELGVTLQYPTLAVGLAACRSDPGHTPGN
ncbi:MAG: NAD-dependent epimerase/dehydratase family protein [Gammaproteobacteria bacterium]|nr:NAD-dependent epimerase/dehydratase family protein [Gammaproteobacteria bacterium]